jgi:hypothetical protein
MAMGEVQKYKCRRCLLIMPSDCLEEGKCPKCGQAPDKMCINDHPCRCLNPVTGGTFFCYVCGAPTCACGDHDIVVVSRVTGYLSEVYGGWNQAKLAEFRDRHRYTIE